MTDTIGIDSEQFVKTFPKTSEVSHSAKFEKINDIWLYMPSHYCFLSDAKINGIVEWGIIPERAEAIDLQQCTDVEHNQHDYLAPFHLTNPELLALYDKIQRSSDEIRKRNVQERRTTLQDIAENRSFNHENTSFHCTGHPIKYTNYKEIDWTIRLFHSIKTNLPRGVHVKPSYNYANNHSFSALQQQFSFSTATSVYFFRGAPDLVFIKKKTSDASVLVSEDTEVEAELLELKQGYSTMPRNASAVANYPNVAGQVIAGLHFLTVAKVLKSIATNKGVPRQVKSRGLLVKRKDTMSLYTFIANVNNTGLASTQVKIQDLYMLEGFTLAHLCAGIQLLVD